MYKVGQTLVRKPEQDQAGLPQEVRIENIVDSEEGRAITIKSDEGTFESNPQILDTFYDIKTQLTLENLPQVVISELDEIGSLFDIYGSSGSPAAGIQVKSKIMGLKEDIQKLTGQTPEVASILGKKLS